MEKLEQEILLKLVERSPFKVDDIVSVVDREADEQWVIQYFTLCQSQLAVVLERNGMRIQTLERKIRFYHH